jgi:hypothetical protein
MEDWILMDRTRAWISENVAAVRSGADHLRYPPWRRRMLILLIVFPFVLGGVLAATLGPLEGLAAFGTAFSLPAFFRHDLVPGPRLSNSIVTKGGHSDEATFPPPELRPINSRAIVRASQEAAQDTAPEIQRPPRPNQFGVPPIEIPTASSLLGPRQRDLEQFSVEIRRYGEELEDWLERYVEFRSQMARQFPLSFRIENDGEAPARNVRLRVRLPKDFQQLDEPPTMDGPPGPPRYRGPFDIKPVLPFQSSALREIGRRLTEDPPDGPEATASYEGEHLVLTYEIGHLNHGPDHLRTELVILLAPSDGEFEAKWEALSANPGPAMKGSLKIRISPAVNSDPPLTTMEEVAKDREAHHIGIET